MQDKGWKLKVALPSPYKRGEFEKLLIIEG